jgi:hypothetical protein
MGDGYGDLPAKCVERDPHPAKLIAGHWRSLCHEGRRRRKKKKEEEERPPLSSSRGKRLLGHEPDFCSRRQSGNLALQPWLGGIGSAAQV